MLVVLSAHSIMTNWGVIWFQGSSSTEPASHLPDRHPPGEIQQNICQGNEMSTAALHPVTKLIFA